ncbi:HSP20-like chaperone [Testicularia cyperi]|uniref:HSP20-like chaperone n=1 Tax=Testicularia cyperi TaxID=1882483 RepID=A0A317XE54_9BASI|nr:HSP20-like chaperone [Testicularia cyperi]
MSLLRSNLFNSPFDDFDVFPSTFRDLMVNPWPQLMSRGGPTPAVFQGERMWSGPRIDLHEEDTRFVLTAELPGVKKEDIKINVDADRRRLTLEGHMRSEYTSPTPSEGAAKSSESGSKPSAGESKASSTTTSQAVTKHDKGETRVGHPLVSERVFGQFARSFTLPPTANLSDDTALKARFHDGLLKLEIPKKAEEHSKTRQIAIESA